MIPQFLLLVKLVLVWLILAWFGIGETAVKQFHPSGLWLLTSLLEGYTTIPSPCSTGAIRCYWGWEMLKELVKPWVFLLLSHLPWYFLQGCLGFPSHHPREAWERFSLADKYLQEGARGISPTRMCACSRATLRWVTVNPALLEPAPSRQPLSLICSVLVSLSHLSSKWSPSRNTCVLQALLQ